MKKSIAKEILFGTAVGDALGMPVEFKSRDYLSSNPITDMIGYGTHHQHTGTWSDDSSLTFCLADSLSNGYDLKDIAASFVRWYDEGFWTPNGKVFDIGNTTRNAIYNLKKGAEPAFAGESGESSNGNGSLMRILPLLAHVNKLDAGESFKIIADVSSITHRHPRSILGCILLLEYAKLLQHDSPRNSLLTLSLNFHNELHHIPDLKDELVHYKRLFNGKKMDEFQKLIITDSEVQKMKNPMDLLTLSLASAKLEDIKSSGYIVDTLEASIWCLINSKSYEEAVLMAVNLGGDTDTTGAVTGGLASIYYGYDAIPQKWIDQIARKDDIEELAIRLNKYYIERFFKHKCPICGTPLEEYSRYPCYVCTGCADRASDISGRKLDFFNLDMWGGFGATYVDTKEDYPSHECYIDSVQCWADEARMGGIVIQKIDDKFQKPE